MNVSSQSINVIIGHLKVKGQNFRSRHAGRPKRRTTRRRGGPPGRGAARVHAACTAPRPGGPRGASHPLSSGRPQLRRGYPLNLSISLSGGKETNQDSPSNGEGRAQRRSPRPRGRGALWR